MTAFLQWVMAGRMQAAAFASLCFALGLLLPPATLAGAATVGLAGLRHGWLEALGVAGISALVLAGAGAVMAGQPLYGLSVLVLGVVMAGLGAAVQRTGQLLAGVFGAALLGVAVVFGFHAALGDPAAWWMEFITEVAGPALDESGMLAGEEDPEVMVRRAASMMTGVLGGVFFIGVMLSLLLARWAQARLDRPGAFQHEFHSLRLPPSAALTGVAIIGIAAVGVPGIGAIARDLGVLAGSIFLVPGIALVHGLVGITSAHVGWLIAFYAVLLVFLPQAVLLIAALGMADSLFDFRARLRSGTSSGDT